MKHFKFTVIKNKFHNKALTCKLPREKISEHVRGYSRIYIDHTERIVREVIYPQSLYFTSVYPDDPIEEKIKRINEIYPDWYKIHVEETSQEDSDKIYVEN